MVRYAHKLIPFQHNGAPNANFDGVDTAGVGKAFVIGNEVLDISISPPEIYECKSNTTGNAIWDRIDDAKFIDGYEVSISSTPSNGQVLSWNESTNAWEPSSSSSGSFATVSSENKTYYVNFTNGDDLYDGTAATWTSGTVGPKKTQTGIWAILPDIINHKIVIKYAGVENVMSATQQKFSRYIGKDGFLVEEGTDFEIVSSKTVLNTYLSTGTGDTISAPSGTKQTLYDAAGLFNSTMLGKSVKISGSSAENNSTFVITDFVDKQNIKYVNAGGSEDLVGTFTWEIWDTTGGSIGVSGGGLTVNDLQGSFVRMTSGTETGKIITIQENTANIIFVTKLFSTVPVDGDTFDIVLPATKRNFVLYLGTEQTNRFSLHGPGTYIMQNFQITSTDTGGTSEKANFLFDMCSAKIYLSCISSLMVSSTMFVFRNCNFVVLRSNFLDSSSWLIDSTKSAGFAVKCKVRPIHFLDVDHAEMYGAIVPCGFNIYKSHVYNIDDGCYGGLILVNSVVDSWGNTSTLNTYNRTKSGVYRWSDYSNQSALDFSNLLMYEYLEIGGGPAESGAICVYRNCEIYIRGAICGNCTTPYVIQKGYRAMNSCVVWNYANTGVSAPKVIGTAGAIFGQATWDASAIDSFGNLAFPSNASYDTPLQWYTGTNSRITALLIRLRTKDNELL